MSDWDVMIMRRKEAMAKARKRRKRDIDITAVDDHIMAMIRQMRQAAEVREREKGRERKGERGMEREREREGWREWNEERKGEREGWREKGRERGGERNGGWRSNFSNSVVVLCVAGGSPVEPGKTTRTEEAEDATDCDHSAEKVRNYLVHYRKCE